MDIAETIISTLSSEAEWSHRISDFHAKEGAPVVACTPGGFRRVSEEPVTADDIEAFLSTSTVTGTDLRAYLRDRGGGFQASCTLGTTGRLRLSVYEEGGKSRRIAISMRVLPMEAPELDVLGLPPAAIRMGTEKSKGLLLITGPTGAGKTTTLAAILNRINSSRPAHILTIEDPIEYVLRSRRSLISQREVGVNVSAFGTAITDALRQRPDVIAIGEVLDHDTVEAMLRAADSGHLVIATMHTRNVDDSIGRLLGFYTGHEYNQKLALLASCLIGVVSQTLVPSSDESRYVLATEVLVNNPASASYIREGKVHMLRNLIRQGRSEGMHTLNQSLAQLVTERWISPKNAFYAAYDDAELAQLTGVSPQRTF